MLFLTNLLKCGDKDILTQLFESQVIQKIYPYLDKSKENWIQAAALNCILTLLDSGHFELTNYWIEELKKDGIDEKVLEL